MSLDDELSRLDKRIVHLRIQFDLFFSGALPKPPLDLRDELDRDVKRVGGTREMKLAQRFLYNTLLNRWNIFTELWNKRLQAREEGARTPTLARRRAAQTPEPPATPPAPPVATGRSASERRLLARTSIRSAGDSDGELKAFYRSFLEARQDNGEGKAPSFEKFRKEIERHVETIRQNASCERVDFRLYLENNKVALKARPLKDEETGT
ncbi:MAG TPA: MXAN_5187 C-terminal domain-containing protein [Candidatus Polarisedimenticolia bacterium]|jgi:hypothetical protein|nr:MXAN_5187 C-terminal domain-containing protein [Candidatus Polarisedimenticolia bacterium]